MLWKTTMEGCEMKKQEFVLFIGDIEKIDPPMKTTNHITGEEQSTPKNQCTIDLKIGDNYNSLLKWTENDDLILVSEDKTKAILIKKPKFLLTKEEVEKYIK